VAELRCHFQVWWSCAHQTWKCSKSLPFASISTVVHLTGRKDDLENNTRWRDGPSPTFVHCDFGPRRRDDPRSIDFDAMRRSCVKKRTDDATGRQWGSVRATAVRRDAVLAGDLKGLDYYVILI